MKRILRLMCVALLLPLSVALAQDRNVTGKVTSADDGSSLPGVNVIVKGTSVGTATDANGNYAIRVGSDDAILVFSFIGLKTTEVSVGSRSVVDVSMETDATQLEEIVVQGYGTILKKEFSGASSSISAENISRLPMTAANQALQGQASGVFVFSNSGTPGGGISVRVRGQSSISATNDPLYVVDGVPVVAGDLTQQGFNGQGQNALAGLNPQDIESIEVLKDASSTAIYGTRGVNGVVLITTKRGKSGRANINVSGWTGWAQPTNTIDKISAQQWVDIKNEARVNSGLAPDPTNFGWDGTTDTDWVDLVFRTARVQEYQANISGGDEKTRYYVSGSFRDEEGTIIGSGYKRGTLRLNLDSKATEIFSFGTSLSLSSDLNQRINNDNNIYGIYSAAILTPPTAPVRDDAGEFVDALPSFLTNAVRDALLPRFDNKLQKFVGNLYTDFKIMDGLNFRSDFGYDFNMLTEDHNIPASTAQGRGGNGNGRFLNRTIGTLNIEPTLRYAKRFNDHSVNAVLGATYLNRTQIDASVFGNNFAREELTYLTSAATITGGSSFRTDYKLASLFARVNYALSEKYIASFSWRRDGSSRFGANNKFANFYAFSLGWNFSDEAFMENISWLSLGKLRASYGTTGNDGIGNFPWQASWSGGANYLDRPAFVPTQIANPDLKWESTSTLDIGLEASFLENRIEFNAGYFNRNTTDLLYSTPVPLTTGFASVFKNIGEMNNYGVELDLKGIILNSSNGLKVTVGGNVTFQRNEIVSLVGEAPIFSGFASAIIEGEPLGTFYGLKYLGVDPGTGEAIFEDFNGDGIVDGTNDLQIIGDAFPDYYGGVTANLQWKGLTLDAFFQFVGGVDIFNNTQAFSMNPAAPWGMSSEMLRRWQQPGDITDVPRATNNPGLSGTDNSRWLSDGSYLRLKNVVLSYDLPTSLVSKAKLRNARIYVQGNNLLTFTRYSGADPEVSVFANTNTAQGTDFLTFPQSKMVVVGINLGL